MTDRIGQHIGNDRLVRQLGKGGFAEVDLGEHLYIGLLAAVTLLHQCVAQRDITQWQQEAWLPVLFFLAILHKKKRLKQIRLMDRDV